MERLLTHYRQVLSTVDGRLHSLTLPEHGILAALLVGASGLLLLFSRLLLVVLQLGGLLLLPCAVYVGVQFLIRAETPDEPMDDE
jgi:hypothetical protein